MIFFTSDHHFSHANVIKYCNRPFSSVEEMNEELVKRWNEAVKPEDTVYYLGDFALSQTAVTTYLPRLNGEKHLIAGNHDHVHPAYYKQNLAKRERRRELYLNSGFKTISMIGYRIVNNQVLLMSHLPYSGDHAGLEDRYKEFRPENNGLVLLHGHVHTTWKVRGHMINVGVDVWDYKPVSIDEIANILKSLDIPNKT